MIHAASSVNKEANMAEFDEFKFPDEVEAEKQEQALGDKFEIEIEDDTPEVDRGKTPMPAPIAKELEKDELDGYDEAVKTKLKQMRKVWHDERREKEAAVREQQEAVTAAQRLYEENKRMRNLISSGEKEYASTIQNAAGMELEMAKRAFKEAYDAGDADRLVEAQQALQEANLKLMQAKNFKVPSLQEPETPVQTQPEQYQQPPRPDDKAVAWQKRNPWFGQDEEMTAAALGLHEKLRRKGVEIGSDGYYNELDNTIRRRFIERFPKWAEQQRQKAAEESNRSKPSTVVAPATRSTAPNKVKLKTSQVQLAKKFGITPEQYAREVLKLENSNG
jgi:hypothetical protein